MFSQHMSFKCPLLDPRPNIYHLNIGVRLKMRHHIRHIYLMVITNILNICVMQFLNNAGLPNSLAKSLYGVQRCHICAHWVHVPCVPIHILWTLSCQYSFQGGFMLPGSPYIGNFLCSQQCNHSHIQGKCCTETVSGRLLITIFVNLRLSLVSN